MIFIWDCILYFKILSPRMSPRIHAQNICILHSMLYPVTTVLLHLHWSCIVSSTVLMSVVLPSSDCQQESSLPSARDYDRWVGNHTSCSNCNSLANHTRSSRAQYFWGHKIDFGNTPLEGGPIIIIEPCIPVLKRMHASEHYIVQGRAENMEDTNLLQKSLPLWLVYCILSTKPNVSSLLLIVMFIIKPALNAVLHP